MESALRRFLVPVIVLLIDRFLKVLVEVIPPQLAEFLFFKLSFQETTTSTVLGFIPLESTAAVVLVSTVFMALFVWVFMNYQLPFTNYSFLSLVLFGGASNLFDRWTSGAVVDVFRISVGANAFVFNIADLMILVGILSIVNFQFSIHNFQSIFKGSIFKH